MPWTRTIIVVGGLYGEATPGRAGRRDPGTTAGAFGTATTVSVSLFLLLIRSLLWYRYRNIRGAQVRVHTGQSRGVERGTRLVEVRGRVDLVKVQVQVET